MLLDVYARLFSHHRWIIALLVLALTGLASWGHWRGAVSPWEQRAEVEAEREADAAANSEPTDANEPEEPVVRREALREPRMDAFLVVQGEQLFQPKTIAALRQMVTSLESLEQVDSLIWIDRVPILNLFGIPEPLLPPAGSSPESFRAARQRVLDHPLAKGQLISADGRTLLMPLTYDWLFVGSDTDCTDRLLQVARQSLQEAGCPDLRVRLTGDVPLFIEQNKALQRNHIKFQVIGYALALVITIVLFRSIAAVIIVASAPALAIYWAHGLLNLVGASTNALTNVILPVLLSMVALTDGVHLLVHMRGSRHAGMTPLQAAQMAIRQVGLACALTSLTTAIGFGSLLLAHAEFIQSFGKACSFGVIISLVSVLTVIPLLCTTRLGQRIHEGHGQDIISRKLQGTVRLVGWTLRHARLISGIGIALTVGLTLVSLTLRPDNKIKNGLPSDSDMYWALQHCDQALGGIETARIVIHWTPKVAADSAEIYRVVQAVEQLVEAEPLLRHPLSIRNLLESFPQQQGDLATRMTLLELLPPQLKEMFFAEQARRTLMTVRIQDLGIAHYEPVFRRLEAGFAGLERQHPDFSLQLVGDPVVRGRDLHRIVLDLAASLGTASVVIFVVLTLLFRSLRLGLISLIPNMFPLVVTASALVLMGGSLDFASICSFTVCLGIAVDDTIHFMTRFLRERRDGRGVEPALTQTFVHVGTPLVITTVILVLGFGTALTSELPDHRMFAAMACATIGAALIGDLLFLPALLSWLVPDSSGRTLTPSPAGTASTEVVQATQENA